MSLFHDISKASTRPSSQVSSSEQPRSLELVRDSHKYSQSQMIMYIMEALQGETNLLFESIITHTEIKYFVFSEEFAEIKSLQFLKPIMQKFLFLINTVIYLEYFFEVGNLINAVGTVYEAFMRCLHTELELVSWKSELVKDLICFQTTSGNYRKNRNSNPFLEQYFDDLQNTSEDDRPTGSHDPIFSHQTRGTLGSFTKALHKHKRDFYVFVKEKYANRTLTIMEVLALFKEDMDRLTEVKELSLKISQTNDVKSACKEIIDYQYLLCFKETRESHPTKHSTPNQLRVPRMKQQRFIKLSEFHSLIWRNLLMLEDHRLEDQNFFLRTFQGKQSLKLYLEGHSILEGQKLPNYLVGLKREIDRLLFNLNMLQQLMKNFDVQFEAEDKFLGAVKEMLFVFHNQEKGVSSKTKIPNRGEKPSSKYTHSVKFFEYIREQNLQSVSQFEWRPNKIETHLSQTTSKGFVFEKTQLGDVCSDFVSKCKLFGFMQSSNMREISDKNTQITEEGEGEAEYRMFQKGESRFNLSSMKDNFMDFHAKTKEKSKLQLFTEEEEEKTIQEETTTITSQKVQTKDTNPQMDLKHLLEKYQDQFGIVHKNTKEKVSTQKNLIHLVNQSDLSIYQSRLSAVLQNLDEVVQKEIGSCIRRNIRITTLVDFFKRIFFFQHSNNNSYYLEYLFENVGRLHSIQIRKNLTNFIEELTSDKLLMRHVSVRRSNKIKNWSLGTFVDFQMPFPFNEIFDLSYLNLANRVFSFFFDFHRAKYYLTSRRVQHTKRMRSTIWMMTSTSYSLYDNQKMRDLVSGLTKKTSLLSTGLLNLCLGLERFYQTHVFPPNLKRLDELFERQIDMREVHTRVRDIMSEVLNSLFLVEPAKPLLRILLKFFGDCKRVAELCEALDKELENEFFDAESLLSLDVLCNQQSKSVFSNIGLLMDFLQAYEDRGSQVESRSHKSRSCRSTLT